MVELKGRRVWLSCGLLLLLLQYDLYLFACFSYLLVLPIHFYFTWRMTFTKLNECGLQHDWLSRHQLVSFYFSRFR